MSRRLLVSTLPGETRAALVVDGRLEDLAIERADRPSRLGSLYHGRVTKVDKSLDGAFVQIGTARPGFLPLSEAPKGLSEGDALAVRLLREGEGGKGPRLSGRIKHPPPWLESRLREARPPALLARGDDALERFAFAKPAPEEIVFDDSAALADAKQRLTAGGAGDLPQLRLDPGPKPLFEREAIEAEIEALLDPRVELPSGGFLLVEPVITLTAVDVNSGRHRGTGRAQDQALDVNLEAASAIARQLRLRALSGLIVIDFLSLDTPERRRRVVEALKRALANDPEPGRVFPMSRSGLVEMTRRRARPALHEVITRPCGIAGGGRVKDAVTLAYEALRRLTAEYAARPGQALALSAAPEVAAALNGPVSAARAAQEKRWGRPLVVLESPEVPVGYRVADAP